jgi:hypothetical protein
MTDFKEKIPDAVKKLVGHICGLIFGALSLFSTFATYILFVNPSVRVAILLLVSILLAYFFGRTAFRLVSQGNKIIISKIGLVTASASLATVSLLALAVTIARFANDEIEPVRLVSLTLLSGAGGLLSFVFFRYVQRNF